MEVILIKICPYLESSFEILGRRWNGLIIHYLFNCSDCTAHFSDIKRDLADITSRALSMKLTELAEHNLVVKNVTTGTPVTISYHLTEVGQELSLALQPIQTWAQKNIVLDLEHTK